MKLPTIIEIENICKRVGGNPPDPISGATVFDLIVWNEDNGDIWATPVIASDLYNIRIYNGNVHEVTSVGAGHITPDEIIAAIASVICPHIRNVGNCPATDYGFPVCLVMPLCKWALEVETQMGA